MNKRYVVYILTYEDKVIYVGKTSNMVVRKSLHRTKRENPKYSSIPVDVDLSKIFFNVVAEFDNEEEALKCKDQLIMQHNTIDDGYRMHIGLG